MNNSDDDDEDIIDPAVEEYNFREDVFIDIYFFHPSNYNGLARCTTTPCRISIAINFILNLPLSTEVQEKRKKPT